MINYVTLLHTLNWTYSNMHSYIHTHEQNSGRN